MTEGANVIGALKPNCMSFYTFEIPRGTYNMQIPLLANNPEVIIYARYFVLPTTSNYNYYNTTYPKGHGCLLVQNPEVGIWFLGIFSTNPAAKYMIQLQINGVEDCNFA